MTSKDSSNTIPIISNNFYNLTCITQSYGVAPTRQLQFWRNGNPSRLLGVERGGRLGVGPIFEASRRVPSDKRRLRQRSCIHRPGIPGRSSDRLWSEIPPAPGVETKVDPARTPGTKRSRAQKLGSPCHRTGTANLYAGDRTVWAEETYK